MAIDQEQVYKDFQLAGLKNGEITAWYERKADELGVAPVTVRMAIARQREAELFNGPGVRVSPAQIIANDLGITKALALERLKELLDAETVGQVHDRDGNFVTETRRPDNRTRLAAVKEIMKIHGEVSDKLEVVIHRGADQMTDAELEERIAMLEQRVK